MEARIVKFKVRKSMKKCLIVGNGNPRAVFAIQINKTFKTEDAQRIMEKVNNGF